MPHSLFGTVQYDLVRFARQGRARSACCRRALLALSLTVVLALFAVGCSRGGRQAGEWMALRPEVEVWIEPDIGPAGEDALSLIYTVLTGQDYGVERPVQMSSADAGPLVLLASATRVVPLSLVILDASGAVHVCSRVVSPGTWTQVVFDCPAPTDNITFTRMRLVDLTGSLGGQGPVSLKLIGLP